MFFIKSGVRIRGISNEILLGIVIAHSVFEELKQPMTITSITDGDHKAGSLHHTGEAFDLRTRGIEREVQLHILSQLKEHLGNSFDVVLEADHIHIEFDPV
jgi:hypothetical protein